MKNCIMIKKGMKFIMKILKKLLIICILLFIYIFICSKSYVSTVSSNISNSVFRLHVIANSDSNEDQTLKYIVRDNLLNYMNTLTTDISSKELAIKTVREHENEFYNIAKKTIIENGFNYDVKININYSYFPTKSYGDITLPAGYYDCLKVEIGEAKGQNWWCVMFPPLCFVDISTGIVPEESKKQIEQELNAEEYSLISTTNNQTINLKFKILEIFSR
ncbi:MAG: stage II sporulation protein R [Clostridiales bacterium]|nr:stage II sporulation protein R [Clostridiales bacterium]